MTVRPARLADLTAVQALDAETFGANAWGETAWQGEWDQARRSYYGPGRDALVLEVRLG